MKVIDFTRKGNAVRFYFGAEECNDYWGDDWNDRPYEHNAGSVYTDYVCGYADFYISLDNLVVEAQDDWHYKMNTPFSKEDMKNRDVPCLIVVPNDVARRNWYEPVFSEYVASDNVIKVYFNDSYNELMNKLIEVTVFACSLTELDLDEQTHRLYTKDKEEFILL